MNHDAAPPSSSEQAVHWSSPMPVSRPGPAPWPAALQPLADRALHHLPSRASPSCPVSNEVLVNYGLAPPNTRPLRALGHPSIGPLGPPGTAPSAPASSRAAANRQARRLTQGRDTPPLPAFPHTRLGPHWLPELPIAGGGASKGRSRRLPLGASRLRKQGASVGSDCKHGSLLWRTNSATPKSCPARGQDRRPKCLGGARQGTG